MEARMAAAVTSPRLLAILQRENFVLRDDLQQDKRSTLLAITRLFDEYHVPYAVSGGLAVQLYNIETRPTMDVDVVSLRQPFEAMKKSQPWARYGFDLVFDHRRHIKLRHAASNVEVDINVDTRFSRLVESCETETIDGYPVRFTSPVMLALAKLRTQRSDWPRDPIKRIQDRVDLMALIRTHPDIPDALRTDPLTTKEMRTILDDVLRQLAAPDSDELPPEEGEDEGATPS
jgi:hypothetical protein